MGAQRNKRYQAYRRGLWAEALTVVWLFFKGYRLLAWRYKTSVGEIDLVFRHKMSVIFCEVKHRSTWDEAAFSLQKQQQRRIMRAAEKFLQHHPRFTNRDVSFDVVLVSMQGVKHLRHAWQQE